MSLSMSLSLSLIRKIRWVLLQFNYQAFMGQMMSKRGRLTLLRFMKKFRFMDCSCPFLVSAVAHYHIFSLNLFRLMVTRNSDTYRPRSILDPNEELLKDPMISTLSTDMTLLALCRHQWQLLCPGWPWEPLVFHGKPGDDVNIYTRRCKPRN